MRKKVALYVRVSTDLQNTESQKLALENYCQLKGITNFEIYSDVGISGAKANRPELDRMLNDCNSGAIESVIVYSFSRFARSTKHLLNALEQFEKLNIQFVSITEQIDTSSALGKTIFTIIASISELERSLIRERVRAGIANARHKGKQIGAVKKYISREPFLQLSKSGLTVREIAKALQCSTATVVRMLRDDQKCA